MKLKLTLVILAAFFLQSLVFGQTGTYTIDKAPFSSEKYDEFSPVYYKNGIVFCSNRPINRVSTYSTAQNKGLFKIYFIDTVNKIKGENIKQSSIDLKSKSGIDTIGFVRWQDARLFSKNLETKFNDGPVTFNSKRDTIYYSRNLEVEGKLIDLSTVRNKLGIFNAQLVGEKWTKVKELRINNEWYNVTTPWLSPDGKKLFFASDKPGGFGGSDLYFCLLKSGYWDDPVNLGPNINTKGNESYPFINPSGELYFSSDGHKGLGGKDIFFSRYSDTTWLEPVRLDAPINSQYDDFGIITDTLMEEGYFSSNRDKSIDIFHFRTNHQQIFYNKIQSENQYCFTFNDNGSIVIDTTNLQYMWSFGDGKTTIGAIVNHCFPGPGSYNVKLDIVERGTGKLFFTKLIYNLELRDFEQPYINSPDVAIKEDVIEFDGLKSFLPRYKILSYSWDFGDNNRSSGQKVVHSYKEKGEYIVNLGLTIRSELTGLVQKTGISKKILISGNSRELKDSQDKMISLKATLPDIRNYHNALIKIQYSAETEFLQDAVFNVELLSSKNKVGINSAILRNVSKKYTIRELFDTDNNNYRYIVDQQLNLMATYPAFREMVDLGLKDVQIKIFVLKDPSEKELHNLIKINGAFADSYFDTADRLTSNAYIMLDQIVKLMKKYPALRLEVAVHSDNSGPADISLALSQKRSQLLVDYLVNRGISNKRLVATGFGGSKPIASNFLLKDRKLNRRIDFIIIDK
jgi:outer membrane protein OmpA-like peptidoglycan-associated protein